jgi:hypothetical protein
MKYFFAKLSDFNFLSKTVLLFLTPNIGLKLHQGALLYKRRWHKTPVF